MEYLNSRKIRTYLLYAIGEILLITIGVLIAVNLNDRFTDKKHQATRCQYLDELAYTFSFDKKDVEENIAAFELWNPRLKQLIESIQNGEIEQLDSINQKVMTLKEFIFFGQRTTTKMEELKFSSIDLIGNRSLKTKLLLYQDEDIAFLRNIEERYNFVDKNVRQYFSNHLFGRTNVLETIKNDEQFLSLAIQKLGENERMNRIYKSVLEKQVEIEALITEEKEKNCRNTSKEPK